MESLARLVTIIMLSIIGAGIGAFFLGRKKPKNIASKILGSIVGVFAVCSGSWLALLPIGIGARLLGLLVAIAGVRQLLKIFRP